MEIIRKHNLIKKIFIPIITLAIFLMPISPSLQQKEGGSLIIGIGMSKAKAYTTNDFNAVITADKTTSGYVHLNVQLSSTKAGAFMEYATEKWDSYFMGLQGNSGFQIQISDKKDFSSIVFFSHMSWDRLGYKGKIKLLNAPDIGKINDTGDGTPIELDITLGAKEKIKSNTPYFARFTMENSAKEVVNISNIEEFTVTGVADQDQDTGSWTNKEDFDFGCINLTKFSMSGCIASFVYVFYELSAMVARLGGMFLDFLIYYSTDSNSYKSGFVTKGWGAVRDIANIFFIIALLYVAMKTILSMGGHDSKKIIGYIVIIALIINFSLFITQVVIDGSNILAKVFYNNITSVDKNGKTLSVKDGGEKSISIGLVDKFNPQKIVSQEVYAKGGHSQFIFITILSVFITLYTAYVFFTVAILFAGRVASLWLTMIFAPIAFASYTLPFDIPGLGHKEWWKNLLENAFLAPIFIFMLYLIVMFAGFLSEIVSYPESASSMQKVMGVVIPFAILTILLMKSKEMAIKYSGEIGAKLSKAGEAIGGLVVGGAVGAGLGVAAFAGRKTIGWAGSKIANSSRLAKMEAKGGFMGSIATGTRNLGKTAGKGSFDVRGIKIAGKDLGSTGLKVGKVGGAGGYEKAKAEKTEKRQRRADELKATIDKGKEGKELKKMEEDLQAVTNLTSGRLEDIDKELTVARQRLSDAKQRGDEEGVKNFGDQVERKEEEKRQVKEGLKRTGTREVEKVIERDEEIDEEKEVGTGVFDQSGKEIVKRVKTGKKIKTGNKIKETVRMLEYVYEKDPELTIRVGDELKSFKDLTTDVKLQKRAVEKQKNAIATDYANKITRRKITNLGFVDDANKEAAHKIKMGVKVESKPSANKESMSHAPTSKPSASHTTGSGTSASNNHH